MIFKNPTAFETSQMQMNYLKNCALLPLLQIENITETVFFFSPPQLSDARQNFTASIRALYL